MSNLVKGFTGWLIGSQDNGEVQEDEPKPSTFEPTTSITSTVPPTSRKPGPSAHELRLSGDYETPKNATPIPRPEHPIADTNPDWVSRRGAMSKSTKPTQGKGFRPTNTLGSGTAFQQPRVQDRRAGHHIFESLSPRPQQQQRRSKPRPVQMRENVPSPPGDGFRDDYDVRESKKRKIDNDGSTAGLASDPISLLDNSDNDDPGEVVARNNKPLTQSLRASQDPARQSPDKNMRPAQRSVPKQSQKGNSGLFGWGEQPSSVVDKYSVGPQTAGKSNAPPTTTQTNGQHRRSSNNGTSSTSDITPGQRKLACVVINRGKDDDRFQHNTKSATPQRSGRNAHSPQHLDHSAAKNRGKERDDHSEKEIKGANDVLMSTRRGIKPPSMSELQRLGRTTIPQAQDDEDFQRSVQTQKPSNSRRAGEYPKSTDTQHQGNRELQSYVEEPRLNDTFIRDDSDVVTTQQNGRSQAKPKQTEDLQEAPTPKFSRKASPIRDSFSSEDELNCPPTVGKRVSQSVSPTKLAMSPAMESRAVRKEIERSPSPSDLRATQFNGATVPESPEERKDSGDPYRILVKVLMCKACVVENAYLIWEKGEKAFHVEKDGKKLLVPGRDDIVALGSSVIRNWYQVPGDQFPIVYGQGSVTSSSSGKILISFANSQGMKDCMGSLVDGLLVHSMSKDKLMRTFNAQSKEIKLAHEKYEAEARKHQLELIQRDRGRMQVNRGGDDEQIRYETDEPWEPGRPALRKSMQVRPNPGVSKGTTLSEVLQQQEQAQSPYFDFRRSDRQTRSRRALTPPPEPERWTRINNPKPWPHAITYPTQGKERVTVAFEDLERLDEGEFLNDNVIAFGLRRIQEQMAPEHRKDVYFFNSFFYTRLMQHNGRKGFNYDAVKRWTKREDIFSYPYLIMPINFNLHWFVAIICNLPNLSRQIHGLEGGTDDGTDDGTVPFADGAIPLSDGANDEKPKSEEGKHEIAGDHQGTGADGVTIEIPDSLEHQMPGGLPTSDSPSDDDFDQAKDMTNEQQSDASLHPADLQSSLKNEQHPNAIVQAEHHCVTGGDGKASDDPVDAQQASKTDGDRHQNDVAMNDAAPSKLQEDDQQHDVLMSDAPPIHEGVRQDGTPTIGEHSAIANLDGRQEDAKPTGRSDDKGPVDGLPTALPIEAPGVSDLDESLVATKENEISKAVDLTSAEVNSRPASTGKGRGKKKAAPQPRQYNPDIPAIISLDSFGLPRTGEIRNLKLYVQAEGKEKRQLNVDPNDLQGMTAKGIPEQSNFSDCGVYLLGYVEEFSKDPRKFVTRVLTRQMDKDSDFANFSPPAKREELRNAILELAPKTT